MVTESTVIVLAKKAAIFGGTVSIAALALQEAVPAAPSFLADMSVTAIMAWGAVGTMLIGAFFAGIVSVVTSWRTMVTKVTAIDAHVNSEKTSDTKTIEFQARENQLLRDQIADRDRIAGLLAQATATQPASSVAAPNAEKSLKQIDTNTAAIKDNTAKTGADVQELKNKP